MNRIGPQTIHARRRLAALLLVGICAIGWPRTDAAAQETPAAGSGTPQDQEAVADEEGALSTSIPALAAVKKALKDRGISPQVFYTGEGLGNATGGVRRGAVYEGLLDVGFDADMDRIAGLKGGTIHVNAFQIHGRGLSEYNLDNLATISGIEAYRSTRLYEAFYDQKFLGDKLSIRAGNLAEESDFFVSELAGIYVNGTFGWPTIWASNLPSGGASYPIATPGVRIKYGPDEATTYLIGIYDGDPAGVGYGGDAQRADPHGTSFRVSDPPLVMAEAQYRYGQDKDPTALAGTVRLGGYYQFGRYTTAHFASGDTFLDDAVATPRGKSYDGNYALYGIVDQMVYRMPGGDDPKKGIGVFARVGGSPADRNYIDFYVDAGVNFAGVWSRRPNDVFGLAVSYSRVSPYVSGLDGVLAASGSVTPIRTAETVLELTYQAQIVPGFVIQPDVQYIFRPGGGIRDPNTGAQVRNAAVFGVRTSIKF